ncbi:MAG: hypothetical protein ACP5RH_04545 [Leptodesmis sp.]|uniref:hypothetical protein n=1 Tax=Leptodesmis sp. TaxID=3100501 RepID=UPI003D0B1118
MSVANLRETLRYSITPCADGVALSVWEMARGSHAKDQPFLSKINHRLSSQEDAQRLLEHYLLYLS